MWTGISSAKAGPANTSAELTNSNFLMTESGNRRVAGNYSLNNHSAPKANPMYLNGNTLP
jgi:hypothetical protein